MDFSQYLEGVNVDPAKTLIMRHSPKHPNFRRIYPWLATERPDLYNAYQQYQKKGVEKQLLNADYVASFLGDIPGRALFVGLYKNQGHRTTTRAEREQMPDFIELKKLGDVQEVDDCLYFDLELTEHYQGLQGKLIIDWSSKVRNWTRWAKPTKSIGNAFPVKAILLDSVLTSEMKNWNELVFTWAELQLIPHLWKHQLKQWRGIYFILDVSDGKGYVGSAYGDENLLGRWLTYAKTGHGGNKKLRQRNPENFRFSILERISPDASTDEVIQLEATWKNRLHTREHGLNEN